MINSLFQAMQTNECDNCALKKEKCQSFGFCRLIENERRTANAIQQKAPTIADYMFNPFYNNELEAIDTFRRATQTI